MAVVNGDTSFHSACSLDKPIQSVFATLQPAEGPLQHRAQYVSPVVEFWVNTFDGCVSWSAGAWAGAGAKTLGPVWPWFDSSVPSLLYSVKPAIDCESVNVASWFGALVSFRTPTSMTNLFLFDIL